MTLRVWIRPPTDADWIALVNLHQKSADFLAPWMTPLLTEEACKTYIRRCQNPDFEGYLICHAEHQAIVGVANLSQIFYGAFQNAYLGYYANADFARQGFMTEGLRLVINHAFYTLDLHRLEANIQPGNQASINLVTRLGFSQEGFSPRYLYINGAWRDHERWALTLEDWAGE